MNTVYQPSNNVPLANVYHRRKISSKYTHTSKVRKGEIKSMESGRKSL